MKRVHRNGGRGEEQCFFSLYKYINKSAYLFIFSLTGRVSVLVSVGGMTGCACWAQV
jgi:hypothetical protein